MSYLDESMAQLEIFEGIVPWMYLDTKGFVTVGVGEMLPTAARSQALGFVDIKGEPATRDAIEDEYERILNMPPGKQAGFYRSITSPILPHSAIDSLLMRHLASFDVALARHFPKYPSFPDAAKIALLDMTYNLGTQGLLTGYPRFLGHIEREDWASAAAECHRNGPGQARNDWTKHQLLAATLAVSAAQTGTTSVA